MYQTESERAKENDHFRCDMEYLVLDQVYGGFSLLHKTNSLVTVSDETELWP